MPIASHTTQLTPQVNGAQTVVLRMYDQNSREYTTTLSFAPGTTLVDIDAQVDLCIQGMNAQLAEDEFNRITTQPLPV